MFKINYAKFDPLKDNKGKKTTRKRSKVKKVKKSVFWINNNDNNIYVHVVERLSLGENNLNEKYASNLKTLKYKPS